MYQEFCQVNRFPARVDDTLTGRASEMIRTFQSGYFLSALSLALTIPDICGKRQYPEERSCGIRYARWFDEYVAYQYRNDAGADANSCDTHYFDGDVFSFMKARMLLTLSERRRFITLRSFECFQRSRE